MTSAFCRKETLSEELKRSLRAETLAHELDSVPVFCYLSPETLAQLNTELTEHGWPMLERAIAFRWEADVQPIHVDGTPPLFKRKSSTNLIVSGGEGNTFQWYDTRVFAEERVNRNGVPAWGCDTVGARLIHEEPLLEFSTVKTDIPHKVKVVTPTVLLCLRLRNNPAML